MSKLSHSLVFAALTACAPKVTEGSCCEEINADAIAKEEAFRAAIMQEKLEAREALDAKVESVTAAVQANCGATLDFNRAVEFGRVQMRAEFNTPETEERPDLCVYQTAIDNNCRSEISWTSDEYSVSVICNSPAK